jgi:hypothetical protein
MLARRHWQVPLPHLSLQHSLSSPQLVPLPLQQRLFVQTPWQQSAGVSHAEWLLAQHLPLQSFPQHSTCEPQTSPKALQHPASWHRPLEQACLHCEQLSGSFARFASQPSSGSSLQSSNPVWHCATTQMPSWQAALPCSTLHAVQPWVPQPKAGSEIATHFPLHSFSAPTSQPPRTSSSEGAVKRHAGIATRRAAAIQRALAEPDILHLINSLPLARQISAPAGPFLVTVRAVSGVWRALSSKRSSTLQRTIVG